MPLPLAISFILKADDFQKDNVQPRLHASPLDSHIQLSTWHLHSDIWQPRLHMSTAQLLIPSYPPSLICSSLSLLHLTQWQFYHSIFFRPKIFEILSHSLFLSPHHISVHISKSCWFHLHKYIQNLNTSHHLYGSMVVSLCSSSSVLLQNVTGFPNSTFAFPQTILKIGKGKFVMRLCYFLIRVPKRLPTALCDLPPLAFCPVVLWPPHLAPSIIATLASLLFLKNSRLPTTLGPAH